jgi:lipid II:glycine glycyltransferase (peptidoglycan interpeptide bridge formation enzyme)
VAIEPSARGGALCVVIRGDAFGDAMSTAEEIDEVAWPGFAASCLEYNYEHAPVYATTVAARAGASAKFFVVRAKGSVIGAATVRVKRLPFLGGGMAYISNGPLVRRRDGEVGDLERLKTVVTALKGRLVGEEGLNLYIRPAAFPPAELSQLDATFVSAGFRHTTRVRGYDTVLIDLSHDIDHLRKSVHRKWRYNLARAEKEGLQIEVGSERRHMEQFIRVYEGMRENKAFHSRIDPRSFFQLPTQDIGLTIFVAHRNGQAIGGGVLSILGSTAVDLFAATTEEGRNARAGYLLYWNALRYAKEHACRWYDLGGIDRHANPGGYVFKTQMGGRVVEGLRAYEARAGGLAATLTDTILMLRNRANST